MKITENGGMRVGVFSMGHASAGARDVIRAR